jgi:hypothetical protein
VKRISTNLFAAESDLTPKLRFKDDSYIKQEADKLVLHYRTLLTTLNINTDGLDLNEIVYLLQNKDEAEKPIDFIAFCKKWISEATIKCKDNYTTALNSFISFLGEFLKQLF